MTERTLTAMYDTRGAAESRARRLVGTRHPSATRSRSAAPRSGTSTSDRCRRGQGLLGQPGRPLRAGRGSSHLRRGRAARRLSADGAGARELAEQAPDVLERSDPVDLDERAESWRQSGWTGYQAGTAGATRPRVPATARARAWPKRARACCHGGTAARGRGGTARIARGEALRVSDAHPRRGRRGRGSGRRGGAAGRQARGRPAAACGCAATSPSARSRSRSSCARSG